MRGLVASSVVILCAGAASRAGTATPPSGCTQPRSEANDISGAPYALQGAACAIHDPAIAVENGATYIFSTDTGLQPGFDGSLLIRCMDDANVLTICGEVFANMASIPWYRQYAPNATDVWAPDVSFFGGLWHVYFAISEYGKPISAIGLVTRSTLSQSSPEPWVDRGPVIWTNGSQGYNAIDANLVFDAVNDTWLVFGSFWNGIQLGKIDAATGLLDPAFPITDIANRQANPDAIEGAFLVYRAGFYYLFVSWNFCCRGAASNYEVRVGRSATITGPYVDQAGVSMMEGGGTHIAGGAFGWAASGGQSLLRETLAANTTLMVTHAYDGVSGQPWLQVVGLQWDAATGWPALVPW